MKMMAREPIKLICDIIKQELQLNPKNIYIANQDFIIPHTKGLFVVVRLISSIPFSFELNYNPEEGEVLIETVEYKRAERFVISAFSRNNEARLRHLEIRIALTSSYSRQAQLLNAVGINYIDKNFIDASLAEGGSMLNRYDIEIGAFSCYSKEKNIDYYDNFPTQTIYEE